MMRWYVINTKPLRENDVSQRLAQAGFEVLNPKVKDFASRVKALFPNYIFACCDFDEATNYHMIKYTRGVNKVLGNRHTPVPISDAVISVIKERLDSQAVIKKNILQIGTRVKIKKGLLKDLIAVIEKPVSADGRVAVLLRLYEREMRAKVSVRDLSAYSRQLTADSQTNMFFGRRPLTVGR